MQTSTVSQISFPLLFLVCQWLYQLERFEIIFSKFPILHFLSTPHRVSSNAGALLLTFLPKWLLMFCPCGPKSSKGQVADSMMENSTSSEGNMKSLDNIKVSVRSREQSNATLSWPNHITSHIQIHIKY